MANTYTQLYIHVVFATKFREALISPEWEERLHLYIIAIIQNSKHKVLAINSASDHIHIFISMHPAEPLSELMRKVKGDSSEWINKQKLTRKTFRWQEGFGAFSHNHSSIDNVVKYILNQKEHHKQQTFKDEYIKVLNEYQVEYDEKYIFKDLE